MRSQSGEFDLHLFFVERGSGSYLASIGLLVEDAGGQRILTVDKAGPWVFIALPPGRYRIAAEKAGQRQTRGVTLTDRYPKELYFYWP